MGELFFVEATFTMHFRLSSVRRFVRTDISSLRNYSVTMQPIEEGVRDSGGSLNSSSSSTPSFAEKLRRDTSPDSSNIDDAIEVGDWAAVGATAAILASSIPSLGARIENDDDSNAGSDIGEDSDASSSDSSGRISYGVRESAETLDSDAPSAKVYHGDSDNFDVSTFHCILLLFIH